jgi:hypothetical protein
MLDPRVHSGTRADFHTRIEVIHALSNYVAFAFERVGVVPITCKNRLCLLQRRQ